MLKTPPTRSSGSQAMSRRRFTILSTLSFLSLMALSSGTVVALPQIQALTKANRKLKVGTTFSQLQCYYLNLDYQETFRQICDLGFRQIRLGSYWHELEPIKNEYDFTTLDWLLEESDRRGVEIILSVGMKAPRYPEFHFPQWLEAQQNTRDTTQAIDKNPAIADRTLKLIDQVVRHTRTAPSVQYWQVENEPFARLEITGDRFLSPEFVQQEVELVRRLALPHQKIMLTNAIGLPSYTKEDDQAFRVSLSLADAIGINVYTKVPNGYGAYLEPDEAYWKKLRDWQRMMQRQGKEAWIAEAQAEPWEPNQLVAVDDIHYPSASPERMADLIQRVHGLGYSPVMLWGCEYWYWHQQNDRTHWWQAIQGLVEQV
ncbi:beta-galactosidase [Leptolyngbya sp. AN03gr2]|uniref:beta-galactosidase n=1 Tax=unclassified Leptolyngbya TaxID=2650499 RepID=UPI003D3180E2